MSAFCVETQNRALVFAALKDDCLVWVEKLCHSSFKVGPPPSPIHASHIRHGTVPGTRPQLSLSLPLSQQGSQQGSGQLRMEENQIYASADKGEGSSFLSAPLDSNANV